MSDPRAAPRRRPWLNAALLLATIATTLDAGRGYADGQAPATLEATLRLGWPYALALLAILGAHEMGHYLVARHFHVDASLPYFLPVPFNFGTLGAVIRMRETPPSRRIVLDIGVAGPLAGFAVALPLLAWGLAHSTLIDVSQLHTVDRSSPLRLFLAWREGTAGAAPGPIEALGDSLLTRGLQQLIWGTLPAGKDLLLHPVALAAWLGMLVTALNLVPVGQLDGGHLLYGLLGAERAERVSRLVAWALLACGFLVSWNWLVWWALVRGVVGPRHPRSMDERPLDAGRRALALAGLLLFVLTFVPVPFTL
jgi:membrane-associated protease RseP (regulator of RpoE activity)